MSERESGMREAAAGIESREVHENAAEAVLEGLREAGFFRDGESAKVVLPEGEKADWIVSVMLHAGMDEMDVETRKKFPARDEIMARLEAQGYKIEYLMDYETMTDTHFDAEYRLRKP